MRLLRKRCLGMIPFWSWPGGCFSPRNTVTPARVGGEKKPALEYEPATVLPVSRSVGEGIIKEGKGMMKCSRRMSVSQQETAGDLLQPDKHAKSLAETLIRLPADALVHSPLVPVLHSRLGNAL